MNTRLDRRSPRLVCCAPIAGLLFASSVLHAGDCPNAGVVVSEQKISATAGGFDGTLSHSDTFGSAVANIGDLDGDGVDDLAVGARTDDDGHDDSGAVWILFMNADGTVKAEQKISDTAGGFTGEIIEVDFFGTAIAALGDLDGDGLSELAVGAPGDNETFLNTGAVWILSLNPDGTVASHQKISPAFGGFVGPLAENDFFGFGLARLGDLNGDGRPELAVGAPADPTGATTPGAVWILSLNSDGTVFSETKIAEATGGFGGILVNGYRFGDAVAPLGDFDGDGVKDLLVGVPGDSFSILEDLGSMYVVLLNADGTVKSEQKIGHFTGDFGAGLSEFDEFGTAVASLGDIDEDGVIDIAVGADRDEDAPGAINRGAVYVLLLNADGTVKTKRKISDASGGFGGALSDVDYFGAALARIGDLDDDGDLTLAVGANFDDDGDINVGAVWLLELTACLTESCAADIAEDDGTVDTFDLLLMLEQWGSAGPEADIAGDGSSSPDGVVDTFDLLALLAAWGDC